MKIVDDFKKFAMRGNVIDLAIGIIIGTAFGKITSSLVSDIIMPPIGLMLANVDLKKFQWIIGAGPEGPISVNYGLFLQTVLDFLLIAIAVFVLIKLITAFQKKEQEKGEGPPVMTKEEILLTEIRDILKQNTVQTKKGG